MIKYAQNKNIDHHNLTRFDRVETCRIEARFIYINYFNLYVFFFLNINLLINSILILLQLGRSLTYFDFYIF